MGVNVESLFRTDGDVGVDDVYLTFGKKMAGLSLLVASRLMTCSLLG
ncbi:hypothetical protein JCM19236_610 [Vibrio sp. JCM 19236]|nr:hypothetical protein JCM19236_610 [Vibrio sp. JCM 19236]